MGMKIKLSTLFILLFIGTACTSSRWIIEEDPVSDASQTVQIETKSALVIGALPNPEQPFLTLQGNTVEILESPLRLEANRVIQRYRPRYSWAIAGTIGAGTLFYLANAEGFFQEDLSRSQKNVLMGAGGVVFGAAMLNMRPYGEPRYTGEKRLLNVVGTQTRADTTQKPAPAFDVIINAKHEGEDLIRGLQVIVNGSYTLNLISELGLRTFSPDTPGEITLELITEFERSEVSFPVQDVLKRYVRVARRNSPLRSAPVVSGNNIITTVAEASLLPWVETNENGWHRVLLGITPTYIAASDGAVVWRPAMSNDSDMVITTSNMAFGSIDVERDIPVTNQTNPNAIAILIGNQQYRNTSQHNEHAQRSVRLMRTYLRETLGFSDDRIVIIENFRTDESAQNLIKYNRGERTLHGHLIEPDSDLFVFYAGSGGVVNDNGRNIAGLIPVDGLPGEGVSLESLFNIIGSINGLRQVTVMLDADFRELTTTGFSTNFRADYNQLASLITSRHQNSWVLFASGPAQLAGLYVSNDRRTDRVHGIMTYYFARALQDGNTNTDDIIRYMQRNMTFTSRRLHNRAQDPSFFGNRNVNLMHQSN